MCCFHAVVLSLDYIPIGAKFVNITLSISHLLAQRLQCNKDRSAHLELEVCTVKIFCAGIKILYSVTFYESELAVKKV